MLGDTSNRILNQTRQVPNQQNQRKGIFGFFRGLFDSVIGVEQHHVDSDEELEDELQLQKIKVKNDSFQLEEPSSDFKSFAMNNSSFHHQLK